MTKLSGFRDKGRRLRVGGRGREAADREKDVVGVIGVRGSGEARCRWGGLSASSSSSSSSSNKV